MNLEVKYIIHSYEIDETRYRTIDVDSGLMVDLDIQTVLKHNLDVSKAEKIEIKDINRFSGRLVKGLNDFETYCRLNNMLETLADYNRASNIRKASEISYGSIQEVNWVCTDDHTWRTPIKSRTGKQRSGCPCCASQSGTYHKFSLGENDLVTWCINNNREDLIREYSSNNTLDPTSIAHSNQTSVEWICSKCGHTFRNSIRNRTKHNQSCPMCTKSGSSIPEMSLYFYISDSYKNVSYRAKINGYEADILISDTNIIIDYRGMYWHSEREQIDRLKIQLFNNLGYKVLVINQHYTYSNIIRDNQIYYDGKDIQILINMVSKVLNIDYDKDKAKKSESLALYSKQSKRVINSIAETHPNICEKWDYDKNLGLTPENFTSGTKYKAWFKCNKCGHSYYSYIRKQINGQGCPACSKCSDAVDGLSDLASTRPLFINIWNTEMNNQIGVHPNKVKEGSLKEAYFTCPLCKYIDKRQIRVVFKNPWYKCKNCKIKTPIK